MKIGISTHVLDYVSEHQGCHAWEDEGLGCVASWSVYVIFVRALARLRSAGLITSLPSPVGTVFYTKDKVGRDVLRIRYLLPLQGDAPSE